MDSKRLTVANPASFIVAVVAGATSALLFSFALAHAESLMAFFVIYLTSLPLFLIGLGGGSLVGMVAALSGALGLFYTMPANIGFVYSFVFAIPTALLVLLALRYRVGADEKVYWYPEGNLTTAITLYPCVIFLAFVALAGAHPGGLLDITNKAYDEIADKIAQTMSPEQNIMLHNMMPMVAKVTPAIAGWSWVFITILCLMVAQSTLVKMGKNKRAPFALLDLHLPNWLIYSVAITGVVGLMAPAPYDYIGKNLAIILGLPLVFTGLTVVHAWAATMKSRTVFLVIFYILISIFVGLVPLVALLGVVDQWFHFREHLRNKQTPV